MHKITEERRKARSMGWSVAMTSARATDAVKASGGCAICVGKGIGIDTDSAIKFKDSVSHRITHAWVNGVMRGGVHIFSVYTKDISGPTGENLVVLEELQTVIKEGSGSSVIFISSKSLKH